MGSEVNRTTVSTGSVKDQPGIDEKDKDRKKIRKKTKDRYNYKNTYWDP